MKLQIQTSSLGALRHLPEWCALLSPQTRLSLSNLHPKSCSYHPQTTTKPILPALLFAPPPLPDASLTTPTPLNLHNCFPTGGFLQTVVSDAPSTTSRTHLRSWNGAHPIQH